MSRTPKKKRPLSLAAPSSSPPAGQPDFDVVLALIEARARGPWPHSERDAKKDQLSSRFGLPLLRIRAEDLFRTDWQLDRLTELIEQWFKDRFQLAVPGGDKQPYSRCPICGVRWRESGASMAAGKYGVQSTEYRVQSTECRVRSAEYAARHMERLPVAGNFALTPAINRRHGTARPWLTIPAGDSPSSSCPADYALSFSPGPRNARSGLAAGGP